MYNLLIGLTDGEVLEDRVLEHTEAALRDFLTVPPTGASRARGLRVDRLLNLPTLLMPELGDDSVPQIARVGHVSEVTRSGRRLAFSFEPNLAVAPLETASIKALSPRLGITDWELQRTHWAVKDIDLYRTLDSAQAAAAGSSVLRFPMSEIERDLVAVMMPFGPQFTSVYQTLAATVESVGMRCLRADDIWEKDSIMDDVAGLLWRARVVVSDLSDRNSNVFYETGIAHAIGRDVILIAQSLDEVPFDLRHLRALTYLNNGEGLAALATGVRRRLETLTAGDSSSASSRVRWRT